MRGRNRGFIIGIICLLVLLACGIAMLRAGIVDQRVRLRFPRTHTTTI